MARRNTSITSSMSERRRLELNTKVLWGCRSYFNEGTNDEIKYEKQRRGIPDQILGFDSWGLDTTADDARASYVNPPGNKTTMVSAGTTQSIQVMKKAFRVIVI